MFWIIAAQKRLADMRQELQRLPVTDQHATRHLLSREIGKLEVRLDSKGYAYVVGALVLSELSSETDCVPFLVVDTEDEAEQVVEEMERYYLVTELRTGEGFDSRSVIGFYSDVVVRGSGVADKAALLRSALRDYGFLQLPAVSRAAKQRVPRVAMPMMVMEKRKPREQGAGMALEDIAPGDTVKVISDECGWEVGQLIYIKSVDGDMIQGKAQIGNERGFVEPSCVVRATAAEREAAWEDARS